LIFVYNIYFYFAELGNHLNAVFAKDVGMSEEGRAGGHQSTQPDCDSLFIISLFEAYEYRGVAGSDK